MTWTKIFLKLLLVSLLASSASATPIINTQFNCLPPGPGDPSTCGIRPSFGYGLAVRPDDFSVGAYVQINWIPAPARESGSGFASISMTAELSTDGPLRPGILTYSLRLQNGLASVGGQLNPCFNCSILFTIGQPFELRINGIAIGGCEVGVSCSYLNLFNDLRFQIIDPTTSSAVVVRDITMPEPRGMAVMGLVFLFTAGCCRQRRPHASKA